MKAYNRILRKAARFVATRVLPAVLVIALITGSIPLAQPKHTAVWAQEPEKEPGPPPPVIDFTIPKVDLAALATSYHPPTGVEAQGSCFPLVGYYFFEDNTPLFNNDFVQVGTEGGKQFLYKGEYFRHPSLGYHIKVYPVDALSTFYWADGCKVLLGDDSQESNQTPSSAPNLGVTPQSFSGALMKSTDEDYLAFWVPTGQTVQVVLSNIAVDLDIYGYVWNPKRSHWERVGEGDKVGTSNEMVKFPVNGQTWLVVRVHPHANPYPKTTYSLSLTNQFSEELAAGQASLRVLRLGTAGTGVGPAAPVCTPAGLTGRWLWQPAGPPSPPPSGDEKTYLPLVLRSGQGDCFSVPRTAALSKIDDTQMVGISAINEEDSSGMIEFDAPSVSRAQKEYLGVGRHLGSSEDIVFPSPAYSPNIDMEGYASRFYLLLPMGTGYDPFSLVPELDATGWWIQFIWEEVEPGIGPFTLWPFPTGGPFFNRWNSGAQKWIQECPPVVGCPNPLNLYVQLAFFDKNGLPNEEFMKIAGTPPNLDILINVHLWRYIPDLEQYKRVPIPCDVCMGDYTYVRVANILAASAAAASLWLIARDASEDHQSDWQNFRPPPTLQPAPQPVYLMRILYGLSALGFALLAFGTGGPTTPDDIAWWGAASHFAKMALSPQQVQTIYQQAKAKLGEGTIIVGQETRGPLEEAARKGLEGLEAILPSPVQVTKKRE